ncbi:putative quinol monooxygenase [Longispora fulva]|nr:antibiotic biosynthesis monooxygenase [Longispora fulva]
MVYSVGIWTVKPGHEEEFVATWQAFADWTAVEFAGQGDVAHLLRDQADPQHYISFGGWPDADTLARWRSSPQFGEHVGRLRAHVDGFVPGTYDVAAEIHP